MRSRELYAADARLSFDDEIAVIGANCSSLQPQLIQHKGFVNRQAVRAVAEPAHRKRAVQTSANLKELLLTHIPDLKGSTGTAWQSKSTREWCEMLSTAPLMGAWLGH